MSTQSLPQASPVESLVYAETLYRYAQRRLDPFSLRCWIIQRLMLDQGLAHPRAERVLESVLASVDPGDVGRSQRDHRRARRCIRPALPRRLSVHR
jgi:hypothetical protein